MDVDHSTQSNGGGGSGHASSSHLGGIGSGHSTPGIEANDLLNANPMEMSPAVYDAIQAGILQHQLEAIHMQSPFTAAQNPTSPYGAMAQMFLTSPPDHTQLPEPAQSGQFFDGRGHRKISASHVLAGVLTPGPSGEMAPDMRMDLMSPMQLEMLARGEFIEGMDNFNPVPLLSPALSHHAGSSYASPVAQAAFGASGQGHGGQGQQRHDSVSANQHALEQLQFQQRQFQEQLALLQEQQRQLQATAAAVAAASGSPYMSPQQQSHQQQQQQQQHRPALTPGSVPTGHPGSSVNTPSPGGYFSPLTSPALEPAVSRSAHLRAAAQHLSPALHAQSPRGPHPLSALSSPALNPVGSSGGAQQTLSPALAPQTGGDVADPDYLYALQGILSGNGEAQGAYNGSPVIGPPSAMQSPAFGPSGSGTGPHRGSLPAKSRPSPMMKPTSHRSHGRGPSTSTSVPTSPMAFKISQGGKGYLPPAAIDQRGVQQMQQQQQQLQQPGSAASTPSPVDLAQIMPPPPVPGSTSRPKTLTPMTPASLMNLGKADAKAEPQSDSRRQPPPSAPPVRAAAKRATANIAPAPAAPAVAKRGSRLVPSGGAAAAKRALAIRPPGGVGVRAATKGAAAAAAAAATNEPETRRTSHKAAEQKRRDSLKAGFDELRLLLPPINTEALDPESGEPIPGSSAPRLLPKSSLVPDDNPNRGVSKVALLKFSNEYIVRLHEKVEKRDDYIDKLRDEIRRLRGLGDPALADDEIRGDEDEDLLDMDMLEGEEDDLGDDEDEDEDEMEVDESASSRRATSKVGKSPALLPTKRPGLSRSASSSTSTRSGRRVSAAE
ncbi:hypothetical protein Q8F55_006867 [Vanrija albida]|uniref:BHLH domain-containing protein n=1 Tax=Vanrija albida TaxID=181172 RepID=A0ABR3PY98_9TREE